MALDGITVSCLVHEWQEKLVGGRITKIAQPESDALLLTIKNYDTYRLHLSASASLPLACLLTENRQSPLTAPNFCMLLRKHLSSARILQIEQPDLERIIRIKIEHLDEMGDTRIKYLIVELMGKHSNIIFCDEDDTIIDSIKRVSQYYEWTFTQEAWKEDWTDLYFVNDAGQFEQNIDPVHYEKQYYTRGD